MMQLREMRYARIEGTQVLVEVKSATEAKDAIKELRHRKKEMLHQKKRILKEQRQARAELDAVERQHSKTARKGGLKGFFSGIRKAVKAREPMRDLAVVEADLARTDDIIHHIDSCIIQLEGRLLK